MFICYKIMAFHGRIIFIQCTKVMNNKLNFYVEYKMFMVIDEMPTT